MQMVKNGLHLFYCSPMPSPNPSCSVNHMEVYGAVAVKMYSDGAVNSTIKLSFWVLTYCHHPVWSSAFFVWRAPRLRL